MSDGAIRWWRVLSDIFKKNGVNIYLKIWRTSWSKFGQQRCADMKFYIRFFWMPDLLFSFQLILCDILQKQRFEHMTDNLANKLIRNRTKCSAKTFIYFYFHDEPSYTGQFYIELQNQADFCLRLLWILFSYWDIHRKWTLCLMLLSKNHPSKYSTPVHWILVRQTDIYRKGYGSDVLAVPGVPKPQRKN